MSDQSSEDQAATKLSAVEIARAEAEAARQTELDSLIEKEKAKRMAGDYSNGIAKSKLTGECSAGI